MDMFSLVIEILTTDGIMLKIALGSIFGLCLGLTGVGGGVLLIPMLQIFCGMAPVLAVGTASLISALVKINASIIHVKAKNVSWRQISILFVGAMPLTFLVTQIVVYFNQHPLHADMTQSIITGLVTVVMVGSLMSVYHKFRAKPQAKLAMTGTGNTDRKALLSGMFCGSVLGSTGVGGGVLLLPVLNNILNVDIKKAIGSSVVLALFLSGFAALGYAKGGQADVSTAIYFVFGSFIGVPVAASLLEKISEKTTYLITLTVISVSLLMYTLF
ncbi:sulfite exporter TauE/SafE family protein [Photobacterium sp. DA100]|uniref:sulfite exporter TauE/SafE family protein n=1 Tax=Photobacterium sp. DA100 TaxID=3027472 RepID=UPI0024789360|nr:sulfite exporter TauE/SafE family protein [Photobacterium sp. DA100]WEM41193.1 sulfite exporter TauE/SafE family protein [Photobacterium sp. DA100]